ncbi:MAG: tetratricopeptide repeat protein [Acidobacteria bacterium]|nr:tetratricopeptide repeat protein [Acidobacteriota bacterium]NIM63388.1 tetratricopeptide repeat protein [Acidobacteriota bacterium]NIO60432.1 tetratricopeptide repeat protein [Acidobacteriota bacterium]NIQ31527.1 tetratricopeptide repeat protein [Acidobacteriota bacterium]NIQ86763.1 tetratricopeptide repeat protein [Acidobacteriota bacterium]
MAAVLSLTLLIYASSLDNEFVHDDWITISQNEHLRELSNLDDFFLDPGLFHKSGVSSHTRPVLLVTFALNYAFGSEPSGFRAVNLALHLINIVLSYLLVRRIFSERLPARQSRFIGLFACAVFAVHPLNTQAVIYISSRSVLLSYTFYVAAVLLYLRWRNRLESSGRVPPGSFSGFLLCICLALLTKENTVSVAGMLILLEVALFQSRRRNARRLLMTLVAGFGPVLLLLVYRWAVLASAAASAGPPAVEIMHYTNVSHGYPWHLATQIKAQLIYLMLFLWPSELAIQHVVAHVTSLTDPAFAAGSVLVIAATAWAFPRWWRGSLPATLILWYCCAMGPEALLRLNMIVNEHRFYLPGIALIGFCGWLLLVLRSSVERRMPWTRYAAAAGLCVLVIALGARSRDYARQWKTACTLWEYTARVSSEDSWANNNAGNCRLLAGNLPGAEEAYRRALELAPDNYLALYNLGLVCERQGRLREAIAFYERFEAMAGGGQPLPEIRRTVARLRHQLDAR